MHLPAVGARAHPRVGGPLDPHPPASLRRCPHRAGRRALPGGTRRDGGAVRPESRQARVRIPADVDRDDRLLAGLSARQLAILGGSGLVIWLGYQATRTLLPLPVFAGLATPVAAAATVLALGRWHGLST